MDAYRGYFLSHAAFVVRALEPGVDADGQTSRAGDIIGCFYVKPNYPGRCSHVCNGGFQGFNFEKLKPQQIPDSAISACVRACVRACTYRWVYHQG